MKITLIILIGVLYLNAFSQTFRKQVNVVFDGNSFTSGTDATQGLTIPAQVGNLLGLNYLITNKAVSGQTTQQMSADYASDIATVYSASNYSKNILVVYEGRNDLVINSTVTSTIAYNNLKAYADLGKATGFKIVMVTLLPSWTTPPYKGDATSAGYTALNTDRLTVNTLIRNNYIAEGWILADIAADTRIGTLGKNEQSGYTWSSTRPTNNGIYSDGTHLNSTGYGIKANIIKDAVLRAEQ